MIVNRRWTRAGVDWPPDVGFDWLSWEILICARLISSNRFGTCRLFIRSRSTIPKRHIMTRLELAFHSMWPNLGAKKVSRRYALHRSGMLKFLFPTVELSVRCQVPGAQSHSQQERKTSAYGCFLPSGPYLITPYVPLWAHRERRAS
ncbi:hypothetical protein M413DRAFT_339514 [Hebeloma cylindrosporum]|uniref:Uncharacterized protein n=1 Tax=Hebeloma cylindrosporum TaxID=76867 RepID=A0A0C2YWM0_HEBCY|nr:hypothetical protein M413DRAFT_339514 [Hebeloma cylindrosporum h7]